jgi:hypothetical protein
LLIVIRRSPADDRLEGTKLMPAASGQGRRAMSATTSAFTLILAEDPRDGGAARDFIVTDNGVLYGTTDRGAHWRCLGTVDTAAFLFDIGFPEASEELLEAPQNGWTRPPTRLPV